jgi:hypothetical protein
MPNTTRSTYRGFSIVTRCAELPQPQTGWASRYEGSFSVDAEGGRAPSEQQFLRIFFATRAAASAQALVAARRSIDLELA